MMNSNTNQTYMTSPARTGKMMAIMLGICIVGGTIFFGMWDYWISQPAPVVDTTEGVPMDPKVVKQTGQTITEDLSFVESDDLRTLAFNALPGVEGSNPTISMSVGDKILFNVINDGITFHSFGVTENAEGFVGIIPGSEIGLITNPLKPDEGGSSEFVAGKEGTYYYICTIPGHRELGMVGEIIVGPAEKEPDVAEPTETSHDFVESDDMRTLAFNAMSSKEDHNLEIRVDSGDEVTITSNNLDQSLHTFGIVADPKNFDSIMMDYEIAVTANPSKPYEGDTVTFTADAPRMYHYIYTVLGHTFLEMQDMPLS